MAIRKTEDKALAAQIEEGLKANGGYCPCRMYKAEDTKCMCEEFREQIKDPEFSGPCHCGLYVKTKD